MISNVLIGLGAGLVSAILFASASSGTPFGLFVLFLLSPLPVVIAGLGWGWGSSALAATIAALALAVAIGPRAALFHVSALGLPAAFASYLALLNRPLTVAAPPAAAGTARAPGVEWYPIGRILTWAALWAGILTAAALFSTGATIELLKAALADTFEKLLAIGGIGFGRSRTLTDAEKSAFIDIMLATFPWAIASCWLVMAVINLWIGAHVTALSGRLGRPWPDLAETQPPRMLPLAFATSIALTFLPGMAGLVASGFASALLFTYMMIGLAILHAVTRGLPTRPILLGLAYLSLLLLSPFSSLLVAMLGLAEPVSPVRRRPPPPPPAAGPPQHPV